jgi:hypothetical protein
MQIVGKISYGHSDNVYTLEFDWKDAGSHWFTCMVANTDLCKTKNTLNTSTARYHLIILPQKNALINLVFG